MENENVNKASVNEKQNAQKALCINLQLTAYNLQL